MDNRKEKEKKEKLNAEYERRVDLQLSPEDARRKQVIERVRQELTDEGIAHWIFAERMGLNLCAQYGGHNWCPLEFDSRGRITPASQEFLDHHVEALCLGVILSLREAARRNCPFDELGHWCAQLARKHADYIATSL